MSLEKKILLVTVFVTAIVFWGIMIVNMNVIENKIRTDYKIVEVE